MKVLFCLINMNLGGTEKSFLNLIETFPNDYEIDLLLLQNKGEMLKDLPEKVKILDDFDDIKIYEYLELSPLQLVKIYFKNGKIINAMNGLFLYFFYKITRNATNIFKIFENEVPTLKENYDVAVAYAGPHNFISYYIGQKVKAERKINWIHFDITAIKFDKKTSGNLYKYFDEIKVVSTTAKSNFIKVFPQFKSKTKVYQNIINVKTIIQLANEPISGFDDNFKGVRILTVGRLTTQKGYDFAIPAIRRLVDDGHKIRYYIIGEGHQQGILQKQINKLNLSEHIVFLGAKMNPYPFMKQTDIYLQPSRHEGQGITVLEAKILNKPIVLTNYTVAYDTIEDGVNGLIVEMSSDGVYKGLEKILVDDELRNKFMINLQNKPIEGEIVLPF